MSDHVWVQENLDAYIVGGLSANERNRLERHLEVCTECAHTKTEISEMEQLMDGIFVRVRPDAGLEDRAIQHLRKARRPRPSWFRFVAAAAAVFVLGGVGLVVQMVAFDGALPLPGMQVANGKIAPAKVQGWLPQNGIVIFGGSPEPAAESDSDVKFKHQVEITDGRNETVLSALKSEKAAEHLTTDEIVKLTMKIKEKGYDLRIRDDKDATYKVEVQQAKPVPSITFFPDEQKETKTKAKLDELGKFFDTPSVEKSLRDQQKALDEGAKRLATVDPKMTKDVGTDKGDKIKDALETLDKSKLMTPPPSLPTTITPTYGPSTSTSKPADNSPGYFGNDKRPDGLIPGGPAPGPMTYFPMPAPPVTLPPVPTDPSAQSKQGDSKGEQGEKPGSGDKRPSDDAQKPGGETNQGKPKTDQTPDPKQEPKQTPPEKSGRMIIRTGEMEFETDSFDNGVDTITRLITSVKGGFIATVNSDKLPNGKTKGSVVVRMPPQFLDKFIYDLRREMAKTSELKNQRLGSLDVTKQYTDIESRLRAARAIEERLIAIIKTGKGEIKDLVAAERELGVWRTKIEEMEGEIRYYSNQVSLSTLTISITEKELQTPTAIVVTETVTVRIEVDEVAKAHQIAMKTVEDLKGRITRSELKQHAAGQFLSILHAEIPPAKKDAFVDQLKKLGIISDFQENQRQHTEGGSGPAPSLKPKQNDVHFEVTMHNVANVRPRLSADLKVATTDVPLSYNKLLAAIAKAKGQVRDGKLNEQDKLNIHAFIDFNVPTSEKAAIDKLIDEIGPILERINIQAPVSELSTERKFGYTITLRDFASIPPRQAVAQVLAMSDVQGAYQKIQDAVAKAKGQIADAKLNEQDKLNINAHLEFTVPADERKNFEKLLDDLGTTLSRTNVQTPPQQLATTKKYGFSLTLRDFASIPPSKTSDLKVATNDVPATYAKLLDAIAKAKGQLVNSNLNEQDKFNITGQLDFSVPADEKGTIDKLITDNGSILSRNNIQVPMNQISTPKKFGYSITLRDLATILPSHASDIKVASSDVPGNYAKLVDAVVKAKGQISEAKLNENDKLNISAVLNFTVPIGDKAAFDKMITEIGTILSRNNVQAPLTALTTDRKFGYAIVLRDIANIPPRETFHVVLAAIDVPSAFRELQEAIGAAKGLVTVGQLTEDTKVKVEAQINFDVSAQERQAIEKALGKVGAVLGRTSSQVNVNDLATDQKVGYRLTIRSTAAIPPRDTVTIKMEVKDVDSRATELKDLIAAGKGRVIDSTIDRHENGQVLGRLKIEIPFVSQDAILKQIKSLGAVVSQQAKRNPQVPENELTTTHIDVTLAGVQPIVPNDEGIGSYVRTSLYMSFKVFSVCLMLIILGVSAVLPWALVIWVAFKIYTRLTSGSQQVQLAADGGPTSPPGPQTAQS